jgi:hypothetical protein
MRRALEDLVRHEGRLPPDWEVPPLEDAGGPEVPDGASARALELVRGRAQAVRGDAAAEPFYGVVLEAMEGALRSQPPGDPARAGLEAVERAARAEPDAATRGRLRQEILALFSRAARPAGAAADRAPNQADRPSVVEDGDTR